MDVHKLIFFFSHTVLVEDLYLFIYLFRIPLITSVCVRGHKKNPTEHTLQTNQFPSVARGRVAYQIQEFLLTGYSWAAATE